MRRGPSSEPTQARPEPQPPNFLTCSFVLQPEDVCGREREQPGLGWGDTFKEGTCSPSHSHTRPRADARPRTAHLRRPGQPAKGLTLREALGKQVGVRGMGRGARMLGGERRGSGQGPGAPRACFLLAWLRWWVILMHSQDSVGCSTESAQHI